MLCKIDAIFSRLYNRNLENTSDVDCKHLHVPRRIATSPKQSCYKKIREYMPSRQQTEAYTSLLSTGGTGATGVTNPQGTQGIHLLVPVIIAWGLSAFSPRPVPSVKQALSVLCMSQCSRCATLERCQCGTAWHITCTEH